MNAIEHGAHFKATQHVAISYVRAKHMVLCRVKDPGEGFSFEELSHAAIMNPPSEPIRHEAIREQQGSGRRLRDPGNAKHHRRADLRRKR